ncbi:MAG: sensor histidine kinase [Flammeovirgaceae bacterium]
MELPLKFATNHNTWAKNSFHGLICLLLLVHPYLFTWDMQKFISPFIAIQQWNTILIIIPIYLINVWVLVPQLMARRKLSNYVINILIAITLAYVVGKVLNQLMIEKEQLSFALYTGGKAHIINRPPPFRFVMMVLFMAIAVGTGFELIQDWSKQEREKESLAKEKVVSELSYLKSQINPHFLFNSLNSIYYLASLRSEDTQKAVLMLSDLMRYVLYESATNKIELNKEIGYLENYIELQKLRISTKKNVTVHFSKHGEFHPYSIEPLLIIPFVENAFKHGISYKFPSYIIINLIVEQNELKVTVANSKHPMQHVKPTKEQGGIGLPNVQKRLHLLYPKKHQLHISDQADEYKIELTLKLR